MIISRIILKNWRNFQNVDVELGNRAFVVGANASGKSNFLDAIRFLRDIAKPGGGLETAVRDRGWVSKIRSLAARSNSNVEIEVHLSSSADQEKPDWKYAVSFNGVSKFEKSQRVSKPKLVFEKVWKNDALILDRPNKQDKDDPELLTQTHLQQISLNPKFRVVADFLVSITYLHLVPQILRHPTAFSGSGLPDDPYGHDLLEQIARTPERTQKRFLERIEGALKLAVPQLKELTISKDAMGIPHLEAKYEHWRPRGAKQREDQFSDGTLRMIGLLWALLQADSVLLLEEPELSLHASIVDKLPALIHRLTQNSKRKRQVILTTHSSDLLSERGIDGGEIIVLLPNKEGTQVKRATSIKEIKHELESGFNVAEVIKPRTEPRNVNQLPLFT